MTIKQGFYKLGHSLKKNSPAIFTTIGIAGLGYTAYLAYKARPKVEKVVEDIEGARECNVEVNKLDVAKGLAEALYAPVVVGVLSTGSILLAQKIQNKRIATLVGALAVEQARNVYFEKKYRKQHGDEAYEKFIVPTDEEEVETETKGGKKKVTTNEIKKDIDQSIGQWYDQSSEYASDDHTYNVAYIDSINEKMKTVLFARGSLLLNEVREALGFERIRSGALLGWTTQDNFEIRKVVTALGDESKGELKEQIWVTWTTPRYVYDDVDFNGRYSVY